MDKIIIHSIKFLLADENIDLFKDTLRIIDNNYCSDDDIVEDIYEPGS